MTVKGIKCPVGHTTIWRIGATPTRSGPKLRYKCVTCGRSFYATEPEKKVRKPRAKKKKAE